MNKVIHYSIVACMFMLQTSYGTSSWKFWQTKEVEKVQHKEEKKAEQNNVSKVEKVNEGTKKAKAHNDVQAFINQHEKVVVMFSLSGCGYCKYLEPIFNKLAQEFVDSVHFKIIQVNGKKEYYKKTFGLKSFPTVIYYKKGQEKMRHGSDFKKMTLAKMRENIKSSFGL